MSASRLSGTKLPIGQKPRVSAALSEGLENPIDRKRVLSPCLGGSIAWSAWSIEGRR